MLSDEDKELIGALQVSPRAPWVTIGEALGISGVTAARRWERISGAGMAWITMAPGVVQRAEQCVAYVEIDCVPAKRAELAAELAQHQMVLTVELTTGTADILLTIAANDLPMLSRYLLDDLSRAGNIVRTRARLATRIYTEGSAWRIREFPGNVLQTLKRSRLESGEDGPGDAPVRMTPDMRRIASLLTVDGRASYAEIAERTGISPTSVRRHVAAILRSGILLPRTDVATEMSGFPVQVYLWADAAIEGLPATARTLTQLRQVRLCATLASAPSMLLCAWLQTVEEVHRLELAIDRRFPQVRIADRLVVLRTVKRMGRLVDHQGRAAGVIPIDIWGDQPSVGYAALPRLRRSRKTVSEGIRQNLGRLSDADRYRPDKWPHITDVTETGSSHKALRTVGMAFIARRLLAAIPVVIGVTIVAFLLIHMVPGNPAQQMLFGSDATSAQIAALSKQLGLTEPLWQQYLTFIGQLLHGNLGTSYVTHNTVAHELLSRAPSTLILSGWAMVVAIVVGVPLGLAGGLRPNSVLDGIARAVSVLGVAVPYFFLALLLVLIFALQMHVLPAIENGTPSALVLPAISLGWGYAAILTRLLRGRVIEEYRSDYVKSARARGCSETRILLGHVFRNSSIPVVTMIGLQFGNILTGAAVIEVIFGRAGIGSFLAQSITAKNIPVVQGAIVLIGLAYIVINLLVDVAVGAIDPRARLAGGAA
jgi:ABC-type dipeptide/oligopeptide/nickel transport system permease component/DNA-binding Lrp family transcriptional regulator